MVDRRFLNFNLAIEGIANFPAANPTTGIQYVVGSTPIGAFADAVINSIAKYDGTKWIFFPPNIDSTEIFNISTGEILRYNGSEWEPIASISNAIKIIEDFVISGTTLPSTRTEGDKFLKIDNAKLYTATKYSWDSGISVPNGDYYISSNNHKIYLSNGIICISSSLNHGDMFFNKGNNGLYFYNAITDTFIRCNSIKITEGHELTESEISDKSFTLENNIASGYENEVTLIFSGVTFLAGVDFTASGNTISFSNDFLRNRLLAEDVVYIQYVRA